LASKSGSRRTLVPLLADGRWLKMPGTRTSWPAPGRRLAKIGLTNLAFPREANALFLRLADKTVARMHAAAGILQLFEPGVYRLMCSWATTEEQLDALVADFAAADIQNTAAPRRDESARTTDLRARKRSLGRFASNRG
jgi:hypothetical protein